MSALLLWLIVSSTLLVHLLILILPTCTNWPQHLFSALIGSLLLMLGVLIGATSLYAYKCIIYNTITDQYTTLAIKRFIFHQHPYLRSYEWVNLYKNSLSSKIFGVGVYWCGFVCFDFVCRCTLPSLSNLLLLDSRAGKKKE